MFDTLGEKVDIILEKEKECEELLKNAKVKALQIEEEKERSADAESKAMVSEAEKYAEDIVAAAFAEAEIKTENAKRKAEQSALQFKESAGKYRKRAADVVKNIIFG